MQKKITSKCQKLSKTGQKLAFQNFHVRIKPYKSQLHLNGSHSKMEQTSKISIPQNKHYYSEQFLQFSPHKEANQQEKSFFIGENTSPENPYKQNANQLCSMRLMEEEDLYTQLTQTMLCNNNSQLKSFLEIQKKVKQYDDFEDQEKQDLQFASTWNSNNSASCMSLQISEEDIELSKQINSIVSKIMLRNFTSETLSNFEQLVSKCIKISMIPEPLNNLGIKLLSSGKFVIAYYQTLLRGENNPLLVDHILNLIETKLCVTEHKNYITSSRKFNQAKKKRYIEYFAQKSVLEKKADTDNSSSLSLKSRKGRQKINIKR